jgi:serine/threonine protein phosphatase PrpC
MKEKMPQLSAQEKPTFETIDAIVRASGRDAVKVIPAKGGSVAFLTDIGYKHWENEDALVLHTPSNSFAVVDGMGGMTDGGKASQIVAEELQKAFGNKSSLKDAHFTACRRMLAENFGGGACYTVFRIDRKDVEIIQGGDTGLIIASTRDGSIKFDSSKEINTDLRKAVHSNLTMPEMSHYSGLENSDRLYMFSDGLSDNVSREELIQATYAMQPDEAVCYAYDHALERMKDKSQHGKPDNISLIVFDKKAI